MRGILAWCRAIQCARRGGGLAAIILGLSHSSSAQTLEEIYVQDSPLDGKTIRAALHHTDNGRTAVLLALRDGDVAVWQGQEANVGFDVDFQEASQTAATHQGILIESPRARRLGRLEYPQPGDPTGTLAYDVLGEPGSALSVKPWSGAVFLPADFSSATVVLGEDQAQAGRAAFTVHGFAPGPVTSGSIDAGSVRISGDGSLVVTERWSGLRLFRTQTPGAQLGAERTHRAGFVISPDGDRVALLQMDNVEVHGPAGLLHRHQTDGIPIDAEFGPNGELFVIDRRTLYAFPAAGGAAIWDARIPQVEYDNGTQYRSISAVEVPATAGRPASVLVGAGLLSVQQQATSSQRPGSASASLMAWRGDGQPVFTTPGLGSFATQHFGNRSPQVELVIDDGAGLLVARTLDKAYAVRLGP